MLEQADVLDQDSDSNTTELTRSYYHRNALGSVMEISTASQTEAASYRYTPYGERTITRGGVVQSSDPLSQNWDYTGRFHDAESGLAYYRARYQDPFAGRFLQRDPLGYQSDRVLYRYAANRPTVFIDPTGMKVEICHRKCINKFLRAIGGRHAFLRITDDKGQVTDIGLFSKTADGGGDKPTEGADNAAGATVEDGTLVCTPQSRVEAYLGGGSTAAPTSTSTSGGEGKGPCDHLPPSKKRCCLMSDAEIEKCVRDAKPTYPYSMDQGYETGHGDFVPPASPPYTCGDFAADVATRCCLNGQGAPDMSSARGGLSGYPYMGEMNRKKDEMRDKEAAKKAATK
jgi:RHS repeat-associated protein